MISSHSSDPPEDHDGAHLPGSCCERVCVAHIHSEASDGPAQSCLLQIGNSYSPKNPQRSESPYTLGIKARVFFLDLFETLMLLPLLFQHAALVMKYAMRTLARPP